MEETDGTLSAFGVAGTTHAFGNRRNAGFAHVAGGGVDPVPFAAFDAFSGGALRTVVMVI